MTYSIISAMTMAAVLLASVTGHAAQPDPLNANAVVPTLQYRPALGDYQDYREAKIGQWHRLNAEAAPNANGGEHPVEQSLPTSEDTAPHAGHHMDHKE